MSFHKVLTAAAFASFAAASSCDFGGYFRDRNHYKEGTFAGSRFVTSRTGDKEGKDITLIGSDDGTTFWTIHGEAAQALRLDHCAINVDFSPKGGPAKLSGKYGKLGSTPNIAILWSDNNFWLQMKIPDFTLFNATRSSIGGVYQDSEHIKTNSWAGFRMISDEEGDKETKDGLTLIGSDDGTHFWMLKGKYTNKEHGTLIVDFSPVGGSSGLSGQLTDGAIKWINHSVWTKMVTQAPPAPPAEAQFIESSAHEVDDEGRSFGVSMSDVNGDGYLDIFVTNSGTSNRLYINDGKGDFTDVSSKAGVADEKGASQGAVFADVNGDGILDLYVTDLSAANHLYIGDGKGNFRDGTAEAGVGDTHKGQSACFADVDGDGDVDLFVANGAFVKPESNLLYINDGKGIFKESAALAGVADASSAGFGCAFGDVDEDGDLDLYVTNFNYINRLYVNDGKGNFIDGTLQAGVAGSTQQSRAASFADLNGDGHLDLFYVGVQDENHLFLGDGKGHFVDGTSAAGIQIKCNALSNNAQGMNIADVDGDGDLDILIQGFLEGKNQAFLYENDGKGNFKEIAHRAGVDGVFYGQGVSFGDIDNDGDLDMYLANLGQCSRIEPCNKKNKLLLNMAKIEKWLKVRPVNENGHATFIGAEVRVFEAGTQKQVGVRAQVDGGSGFASQNAYDVYFGLSTSSASMFDIELRCGGAWTKVSSSRPNKVAEAKCSKATQSLNTVLV